MPGIRSWALPTTSWCITPSNGRSVYSFCMCPGGTVVAATSEPTRVVTNGMSQYSRKERNANAGIVVGISPEQDFPGGALAGMELQEGLESRAYELGGSNYCAPAQLVGDFMRGAPSSALGEIEPSYQPGVRLGNLAPLPAGQRHRGHARSTAGIWQTDSRV